MKFLNIPERIYSDQKKGFEMYSRLFNPAHIVSICPEVTGGKVTGAYLDTVDGKTHSIPEEAVHEAFLVILGSDPTAPS